MGGVTSEELFCQACRSERDLEGKMEALEDSVLAHFSSLILQLC